MLGRLYFIFYLCKVITKNIAAVASIRNYSWLALSDSFPEAVIQQCQQLFNERVISHRDHILNVISTLKDWC